MRDLVPSHLHHPVYQATKFLMGSMDGTVVRELASYQCCLCSNPGLGIINGLSLLVGSCFGVHQQKPTLLNSKSIWKQWTTSLSVGCASENFYLIFNYVVIYLLSYRSCDFFFFQSIDEYANRLIDSNHYATDEVRERRDGIVERRQNIEELSKARRSQLEESRKLQQFERDADEVKSWITEKLKIACDESYKVRINVTATH